VNFALTEDQQLLRKSVREFAETEIRPNVMTWDESQRFPKDLLPKLAGLGLMGIQFPDQYGGAGMSAVDYCICIEELARVDPSVSLSVAAHNGLGAAHISMFATEEQKQKYLVPLARGEKLAAWGLTEPGSGSDAAAMRTTAVKDGACWVLNGSKAFITHGTSADTLVIMAVTDKSKGAKGISAFILERGIGGLLAGKKEDKLGMRASETTEVLLQNCRVPASQMIGEEGQGFIQTCRCSMPAASASRRWRSASRRAPMKRRRDTPRAQAVRPRDRVVPVDPGAARAARSRRSKRARC
jgi:alkylation response protein AidB-like acyl-CoA dehydrogenase